MEKFLTVRQAAFRLNLKPETVREHLETGELCGIKHRDNWSISVAFVAIAERKAKREPDWLAIPKQAPVSAPKPARRRLPKWVRPALD